MNPIRKGGESPLFFTLDGFVKSPSAALRFNFDRCGAPFNAPHSSVFARLASGAFYEAIIQVISYEIIILH